MKIGILGAGQLARMIALAGYPLGMEFIFLDPSKDACANPLGTALIGDYDDPRLLATLAEQADVVTYEFENVPAEVAAFLSARTQVFPNPKALAVAQDRLFEKDFFRALDIATPNYAPVDSLADLQLAMQQLGYPAIVKSRTQGYDGKGQVLLKSEAELADAWQTLNGVPAIVEAFMPFTREVSIIAARSQQGEIVFYPLSENQHKGGILRVSLSTDGDPLQAQAEAYVSRLLEELNYVGILALELFDLNGQLVANEFAPRVHNSGHWTIEGAYTSQFENHLRAIANLPLGCTQAIGASAMVNFIGGIPSASDVLSIPGSRLHLYGKSARKGRKVAHVNLHYPHHEQLIAPLKQLSALAEHIDDS